MCRFCNWQLLHVDDLVSRTILSLWRVRKQKSKSIGVRMWRIIGCSRTRCKRVNSTSLSNGFAHEYFFYNNYGFYRTLVDEYCGGPSIDNKVYIHTIIIGLSCIPTSFWWAKHINQFNWICIIDGVIYFAHKVAVMCSSIGRKILSRWESIWKPHISI